MEKKNLPFPTLGKGAARESKPNVSEQDNSIDLEEERGIRAVEEELESLKKLYAAARSHYSDIEITTDLDERSRAIRIKSLEQRLKKFQERVDEKLKTLIKEYEEIASHYDNELASGKDSEKVLDEFDKATLSVKDNIRRMRKVETELRELFDRLG